MSNKFEDIIKKAETIDQNTELDIELRESEKIERWKAKRVGLITASQMDKFMKSGRGKDEVFGKDAISIILQAKGEQRTGVSFDKELDLFNFRWGNENEPKALEKVREKYPDFNIIGGSEGEEIIFRKFGDISGDSPDFEGEQSKPYTIDRIYITGEIKCPVSRLKIEREREPIVFFTTARNGKRSYHEYFWQMIKHLIANPKAEVCVYAVYDAYEDVVYCHELKRAEVITEIEQAKERLGVAESVIHLSKSQNWSNEPILNINNLIKEEKNE